MHRLYCTYFDAGYLSRGILMIGSLLACDRRAHVYVLALDESVRAPLADRFPSSVTVISRSQFEQAAHGLAELKAHRTPMEYVFTGTAAWMRYVQQMAGEGQWVTYVDADIYFLASVEQVYHDLGQASVGIIEHRHPRWRRDLRKYGRFNVGWVSVRTDDRGRACLRWWDDRLREWCYDRVEGPRFADQGYLTAFPAHDWGVTILTDPGFDVAPWNLARHTIRVRDGALTCDGRPLVFFHFHGVRRDGDRFYLKNMVPYGAWPSRVVKQGIYTPYVRRLSAVDAELCAQMGAPRSGAGMVGLKGAVTKVVTRVSGDSVRV